MKQDHPVQICTQRNVAMGAFDLAVFVGNFKTEEEAAEFARELAEFINANANGSMARAAQVPTTKQ